MSIEQVKILIDDETVTPAIKLAEELCIPFDGVVYAGIVAITKGDSIPPGNLSVSGFERSRHVRLSTYSYKILKRFAEKNDIDCEAAINMLLRFALTNKSIVDQYYRERIDTTSPTKISKSR